MDTGNVGDLSTCSALCHDDGSEVRPFAWRLSNFRQVLVIHVGRNNFEQALVLHGTFDGHLWPVGAGPMPTSRTGGFENTARPLLWTNGCPIDYGNQTGNAPNESN